MLRLPLTEEQFELVLDLVRLREEHTKRAAYLLMVKNLSTLETSEQVTKEIQEDQKYGSENKKPTLSQQNASNVRLRCLRVIDLVNQLLVTLPAEEKK